MIKNPGVSTRPSDRLAVVALFSLTLCFFGPARIYFSNVLEFSYGFGSLLPFFAGLGLAVLGALMLLLKAIPKKPSERLLALLLALTVLLWLQGNILVWNYGLLDGRDISWNEKIHLGLIDSPLWIIILALALIYARFLKPVIRPLALALIAIQGLALLAAAWPHNSEYGAKHFGIDLKNQFSFSGRRNVIIMVLDTFQTDVFQELCNENKEYEKIFAGFTYFRNALGASPSTITAIPAILTGRQYDNSQPLPKFLKTAYLTASLPLVLKRHGYRCDLFPHSGQGVYLDESLASNLIDRNPAAFNDAAFLMDLSLFRQLPHFLKSVVYNRQSWFLTKIFEKSPSPSDPHRRSRGSAAEALPDRLFVEAMARNARADSAQPVFKFYHLRGVHPALRMNASCQFESMPFNRRNFQLQATGLMKLMARFLAELKRIGVFENSQIFIVGDHGPGNWELREIHVQALGPGLTDQSSDSSLLAVKSGALPLILFKPFARDAGEALAVSDAPVCLGDIPATAAATAGLKADFPGLSFTAIGVQEERPRRYLYYKGFRSSRYGYMKPITEFWVRGFSWLDSSWRASGRVFLPGPRQGETAEPASRQP